MFGRHENEDEQPHPSVYVHKPGLPSIVAAAFTFVQMSNSGMGNGMIDIGDTPKAPRKRSEGEQSTLEAAFMVIRHYLTGEMTFEDKVHVIDLPAPKKATYGYPFASTDQTATHPFSKGPR